MNFIYVLIGIALIIINLYISALFDEVAAHKGFDERKYFWICFFFGIAGYLLVVALPDLNDRIAPQSTQPSSLVQHTAQRYCENTYRCNTVAASASEVEWTCGNCQTVNSVNYGQCKKCGAVRG